MKKMYKVLACFDTKGGGHYWSRVGTAFTNRDESINVYLDSVPKHFNLQIREMDAEDLAKRSDRSGDRGAAGAVADAMAMAMPMMPPPMSGGSPTPNDVPF